MKRTNGQKIGIVHPDNRERIKGLIAGLDTQRNELIAMLGPDLGEPIRFPRQPLTPEQRRNVEVGRKAYKAKEARNAAKAKTGKHPRTAAERKAISRRMKAYWRKKHAAAKGKAA